ncbi:uncharacterized protein I206_101241 [Kwoniella pini CBS 10737]|uniref:Myb-like domain-containing protein n=1 Tax=Kwoniella pini CBS 10737 TaxID=1296096 RepID=A0A1B9IAX7_9TREE|nr:uncharacterized protein I206_00081 [Kwoniella pini CBS 10737]OCF52785.1 hypothetical protein I206_00081 [Kwoniella pini CBS 10737]
MTNAKSIRQSPSSSNDQSTSSMEDTKPQISSANTATPKTPKKRKPDNSEVTPSPNLKRVKSDKSASEGWTSQARLDLFEAIFSTIEFKWDVVATQMGSNHTAKQCREQWRRTTVKRIRKALGEE